MPAGQTPEQDLDAALDNIFNHPNVGPFIATQLIQRLVTSNPSPQYVERVARKFDDDGTGKRGNLAAVVKRVLLDPEARAAPASATAGKLKEPLLRLTQLWRAYDASSQSGKYNVQNITGLIGQGPLQAPSVFNFFSPFYAPPGEIADQGLVAPEMQIATEYLSSLWTDYVFVHAFCYTTAPIQGCPPYRMSCGPISSSSIRAPRSRSPPIRRRWSTRSPTSCSAARSRPRSARRRETGRAASRERSRRSASAEAL